MARPKKTGLNYYPLDVDMFGDIKIRKLIHRKGTAAVAVYIDILCEIYKNGYYLDYDEDTAFEISSESETTEEYVDEVVRTCAKIGLFDPEIFANNQVLTSESIQCRYLEIKKEKHVEKYQLLKNFNNSAKTGVFGEKTMGFSQKSGVSDEKTPVFDEKTPHIKEKKSKVKYISPDGDYECGQCRHDFNHDERAENPIENSIFGNADFGANNGSSQPEVSISLNGQRKPEISPKNDQIRRDMNQDADAVWKIWNNSVVGTRLQKVVVLSTWRRDKIAVRLDEMKKVGEPMAVMREVIRKCTTSKWMQGDNDRGWKVTFDWLITNSNNWVKAYEGRYDDSNGKQPNINNTQDNGNKYWNNVQRGRTETNATSSKDYSTSF